MTDTDSIIKKNFTNEIQQKRVKKELMSLRELNQNSFKVSLQNTPLGLKIIVELKKEAIENQVKENSGFQHPIIFEFLLEPKFPFVFPKLFCKTSFSNPTLADGRDFTNDIIGKVWTPALLLKDVVILIPRFLKKISESPVPEETQLLGQYHLGHMYNLEDFLSMDNVHLFPAKEIINSSSSNNERYIMIAESFFLNLESVDKKKNTLRLLSWAHVQSIQNIKKSKDDEATLIFTWHDQSKTEGITQNAFVLEQAKQLVELIIKMGQKYGVKVNKSIKKFRDLKLADVTAQNYEGIKIEELLDNIAFLEQQLEQELTIDVINLLMNLYQKAVEYYSAFNDPSFQEFVQKLHILLNRPDVQAVLQSKEENDNIDRRPSRKDQEEDDGEEEKKENNNDRGNDPMYQHGFAESPLTTPNKQETPYKPQLNSPPKQDSSSKALNFDNSASKSSDKSPPKNTSAEKKPVEEPVKSSAPKSDSGKKEVEKNPEPQTQSPKKEPKLEEKKPESPQKNQESPLKIESSPVKVSQEPVVEKKEDLKIEESNTSEPIQSVEEKNPSPEKTETKPESPKKEETHASPVENVKSLDSKIDQPNEVPSQQAEILSEEKKEEQVQNPDQSETKKEENLASPDNATESQNEPPKVEENQEIKQETIEEKAPEESEVTKVETNQESPNEENKGEEKKEEPSDDAFDIE